MEPASIRTKNPGAMWPGPSSKKFGSKKYLNLKDGNKIAVFDTFEQGAAAQFDLWARSYSGMDLASAIKKWSGHNSSTAYAAFMKKNGGVTMGTVITKDFLSHSPKGWRFMKAQAHWEAGKPYPMTDAQWQVAQQMAFNGAKAPQDTIDVKSDEKVKENINVGAVVRQGGIIGGGALAYLTDWKMLAVAGVIAIASVALWIAVGKPKFWKKDFWR